MFKQINDDGGYSPLNIERWITMITIRVKTRYTLNNSEHYIVTSMNCTFHEAIKYFLHDNPYRVQYNYLTSQEYLVKNISVELLEG